MVSLVQLFKLSFPLPPFQFPCFWSADNCPWILFLFLVLLLFALLVIIGCLANDLKWGQSPLKCRSFSRPDIIDAARPIAGGERVGYLFLIGWHHAGTSCGRFFVHFVISFGKGSLLLKLKKGRYLWSIFFFWNPDFFQLMKRRDKTHKLGISQSITFTIYNL